MKKNLPIGVFDSGVGGITVLRALMERLPHEDMLYLGDTARLPYGTKSATTISRYATQAAEKLVERNVKLLVIACNTATAAALEDLRKAWPNIPVIGVVEPGAKAACAASKSGEIAVLATESTISNGAYQRAINNINPSANIVGQACSILVSLAEEGWTDGNIVEAIAERYLSSIFSKENPNNPDCIVLGCTHFPPFRDAISNVVGPNTMIVDSAATTSEAVAEELAKLDLLNDKNEAGTAKFMTTDDIHRFARTGSLFLGHKLPETDVELVNL